MLHSPSPRFVGLLLSILALLASSPRESCAENVVEKFETGQTKAEYRVKDGKRYGQYTEYYLGGQVRIKATYKRGELNGPYTEYYGNGKVHIRTQYSRGVRNGSYTETDEKGKPVAAGKYVRGKLEGVYKTYTRGKPDRPHEFKDGELFMFRGYEVHDRSLNDMTREFQKIHASEPPFEGVSHERLDAIRRLNAYRYLAGVASNVELDETLCDVASEETESLAETKPENVAVSDPRNRAVRIPQALDAPTIFQGIDLLVADTVNSDIHGMSRRRACLDPELAAVGLARNDNYVALTMSNISRARIPDWKMIGHPAAGYTPVDYFSADRPWLVIIHEKAFQSIIREKSVQVKPILDNLQLGRPLVLENKREFLLKKVEPKAPSHHVFTFSPQGLDVTPGKRYWVQITGWRWPDGETRPIEYIVEFCDPLDLTKQVKSSKKKSKGSKRKKKKTSSRKKSSSE